MKEEETEDRRTLLVQFTCLTNGYRHFTEHVISRYEYVRCRLHYRTASKECYALTTSSADTSTNQTNDR
jgi:hypothetical protein